MKQFETTEATAHKTITHFSHHEGNEDVVRRLNSDLFGSDIKRDPYDSNEEKWEILKSEVNASVDKLLEKDFFTDFSLRKALTLPSDLKYRKDVSTNRYSKPHELHTVYHSPVESSINLVDESVSALSSSLTKRPSSYIRVIRPHNNTVTIIKSRYRKSHPAYTHPVKMTMHLSKEQKDLESSITFKELSDEAFQGRGDMSQSSHRAQSNWFCSEGRPPYSKHFDEIVGTSLHFDMSNSNDYYESHYINADPAKSIGKYEAEGSQHQRPEITITVEAPPDDPNYNSNLQRSERMGHHRDHLNTITEESSLFTSHMNESSAFHKVESERHGQEEHLRNYSSAEQFQMEEKRSLFAQSKQFNPSCLSLDGPLCSFSSPRDVEVLRPQGRFLRPFACVTRDLAVIEHVFGGDDRVEVRRLSKVTQSREKVAMHDQESHDLLMRQISGDEVRLKGFPSLESKTVELPGVKFKPWIGTRSSADLNVTLWINAADSLTLANLQDGSCTEIPGFWGSQKRSGFGFQAVANDAFTSVAGLGFFDSKFIIRVAVFDSKTMGWNFSENSKLEMMTEGSI